MRQEIHVYITNIDVVMLQNGGTIDYGFAGGNKMILHYEHDSPLNGNVPRFGPKKVANLYAGDENNPRDTPRDIPRIPARRGRPPKSNQQRAMQEIASRRDHLCTYCGRTFTAFGFKNHTEACKKKAEQIAAHR